MKNTIFNKAFVVGFIMAFITFVIFNFLTFFVHAETRLRDRIGNGGFPFTMYEWGGEPYIEKIVVITESAAIFWSELFTAVWSECFSVICGGAI